MAYQTSWVILMPKSVFYKDSSGSVQSIVGGLRNLILFPRVFV